MTWHSTGQVHRIPGEFDRVPPYDPRSGDHLWTIASMYRWNPGTEHPHLNPENLLLIAGPGCYYCAEPYTPRLATRRCPGDG